MSDATTAGATPRTPEQIQADLEATRLRMSATVDQLVQTLSPSHQVKLAKENLLTRGIELKDQAARTIRAARDGDTEALKQVGYVVIGAVGFVGLCVLRATVRRRRG